MGSPYLNSGETIILTTNRVSADSVPYDVMLTTERIFFIDNRNARFEPRIIPLNTILSVQGGKTPAQDPAITLLFRTGEVEGGARQPLNLIFSQDPNENRKPERDDWVRSLIQLSIRQHERELVTETVAIPEGTKETGLRPAVRHGIAPEMVRPLSNVVESRKAPAPVTVIPDEVEEGGDIPALTAAIMPVKEESPAPEPVPIEPATDITPVLRTPPPVPAPPARVIIPQIIEELLPVKKTAVPLEGPEPAPAAGFDPEVLFRAVPTAVRSMTVTEERALPPLPAAETITTPESVPVVETAPEQAAAVPLPSALEPREAAEILRALHTGAVKPVTPEPSDTATSGTEPEPAPGIPQESIREVPESLVTLAIPENVMQESVGQKTPEEVVTREPAAADASRIRHPLPPAREIRPLRTTLAYAAVLLLIIALAAAGVVLLLLQGPGQTDNPVTPIPTRGQIITLPPEMVQPTTVIPAILPSATNRIATTVPSVPALPVPQVGVWVRVNSTAHYFGNVGNPELMQKISGTGDNFYKVLRSDRPVQVSVQKQDNSGALLAVAVYRDGTLIGTRSVTSPMGTVDLLIDPLTARAPGLTENDTLPEHAATPAGLENY
jgi:hypothetical protein